MKPIATLLAPLALAMATSAFAQTAATDPVFLPPPALDGVRTAEDRTIMNVARDVLTDRARIAMDAVPQQDGPALTFAAIGEPVLTVSGETIGAVTDVTQDADGELRTLTIDLVDALPGSLDSLSLSAAGAARTSQGVVLTLSQDELHQMIEANS